MASIFLPDHTSDSVLDISHWNGAVDFASLKREGVRAVFIKATEGEHSHDPLYPHNAAAASAAGLLWAPYHFLTNASPDAQFANLNAVAALKHDMVVMLDWERSGETASVDTVVALGELVRNATGRAPVLYCGRYQLTAPHPILNEWPLMLAEWGEHAICPPGWAQWMFHQYTGHGQIHGIHGQVDRSVFAGTEKQLEEWWAASVCAPAESILDEVVEVVADVADVVEDTVEGVVKKVTKKKS